MKHRAAHLPSCAMRALSCAFSCALSCALSCARQVLPLTRSRAHSFISCWAEKTGSNGFGEVWVDAWGEEYGVGGRGMKVRHALRSGCRLCGAA